VIAVSHDLRRILSDELRVPRRVQVIHNGIDGERFVAAERDGVRRELGLGDAFVVGTAAVLTRQKGLFHLLEAARLVKAADPGIRFVVAGDGPLRAELEARARTLGVDDVVRFVGYRRDVPELLAALDLHVMPSLWEGLPLALLEALASGKPIVATRVGGNPEVVEDGVNGLVVPPADPAAIARAVLALRRDPAARARMQAANLERFARRFSVGAMTAAHLRAYRALVEASALVPR
jgi:glycosyltransferase involved in cell wall biosynthesis